MFLSRRTHVVYGDLCLFSDCWEYIHLRVVPRRSERSRRELIHVGEVDDGACRIAVGRDEVSTDEKGAHYFGMLG